VQQGGGVLAITYGGGSVSAALVRDVVTLPSGSRWLQTLGAAVSMQLQNASGSTTQPWDGLMVRLRSVV
jgi:hypothetical protein